MQIWELSRNKCIGIARLQELEFSRGCKGKVTWKGLWEGPADGKTRTKVLGSLLEMAEKSGWIWRSRETRFSGGQSVKRIVAVFQAMVPDLLTLPLCLAQLLQWVLGAYIPLSVWAGVTLLRGRE